MIGLVVTGHGHFADGIHTSAQMIAGGVYGKAPAGCSAFCGGLVICAAKSGSRHPKGHPLPLRCYVNFRFKPCRCCRRPGSCS